ncbi:glycosyltransferase [Algoriphagus sp. AGSA1]|uniref:glycosyltransferase n=1 Tax=Algoriphagus sp. AGSA1 TaxID=2907213 RepID=UPI001F222637|nr:glycosyltransferase [Algoriphagus sp. AGSA1]MCE7055263.1 glycosyltransferase [Algoriphagus sp. AGSA1]
METLEILNIPNYYASYYLYGFSRKFKLKYRFDARFERFNNRPFLVFQYKEKIGVIDNNDPHGVKPDLYDYVSDYFVTNKLKTHSSYNQEKIRPLFPHYPINVVGLYLKTFGWNLPKRIPLKKLVHQLHILRKRPTYTAAEKPYHFHNYVFFSANLWKKEQETNQIRADFMQACRSDERIEFEGGFVKRGDGDSMGFENFLCKKIYKPKVFSELSSRTLLALNNPAVLGAVSWRYAEYLTSGTFVISFPEAIEFPVALRHGVEVHYVQKTADFKEAIETVFSNPDYHRTISEGARTYFEKYCTPEAQTQYILKMMGLIEG